MHVTQAEGAAAPPMRHRSPRLAAYLATARFDRPTLVLDLDQVTAQYQALKAGLGRARIHYAVKANPAPQIIDRLIQLGAQFDAASRGEIALCLSRGARPDTISYGNTVKRASDIAFAFEAGIRLFAADAEEELEKIARHAPGAEICLRLMVTQSDADWPLTRKFGMPPGKALRLARRAQALGLAPVGLSFHVGSQTRTPEMWTETLDEVATVWHQLRHAGLPLSLLNIGGGFPASHGAVLTPPADYAARVMAAVAARIPDAARIMAEPGRALVAEAGIIAAEVLLVDRKSDDDLCRWVYLDIGKFSGLAETMDEAIRYQFATARDQDAMGPCILAGPSCDSADVLYEKRPVQLPLTLQSGDRILILNAGAYTSSYSSVGFNGFPPLDVVVL